MDVRVLIVDDSEPFRAAAAAVVAATDGFLVVGEVASAEASVTAAVRLHPDLILMDVKLPGADGYAATREVRGAAPFATVLLLSTHDADEGEVAACGAAGFVAKAAFGPDVLEAFGRDRP